ncbi:MAG: mechanosensitive ion channel family protein [Burkholderiales bacterium]
MQRTEAYNHVTPCGIVSRYICPNENQDRGLASWCRERSGGGFMKIEELQTWSLLWQSFGGVAMSALRIIGILFLAWLAIRVAQRGIRTLRMRIATRFDDREAVKRAETLGRVFRYLAAVVISLVAGMLVLGELGVSVAPILGAAGVVGLAVGFGAQSLVKDYFTGFFLLLENQIRQGDVVKLGDHAGLVEDVTLRYVQLRDYDGNVHFVPNGTISTVVNMSRGFAQAVVDVGVGYGEDLDRVIDVMRKVGSQLRADPSHSARILDDLEVAGVEAWADSAVTIRARFRVLPLEQWTIKREFLRRLKRAFDDNGIEIPFPQMRLHGFPAGLAPTPTA